MKIPALQIENELNKRLAPVYLVSGDEPLQYMEVTEAICKAAEKEGYNERQVISVEPGYEWASLMMEASAMSLFSEKKILDVRLPTAKPGREGGKVLREYAKNPPPDTLLLLRVGRFEKGGANSAWAKALDAAGVFVQIWDLKPHETFKWVENRLRKAGFQADRDAVRLLTERIEGNLLAGAQEVEKLRMILDPGPLSFEDVKSAVTDSSRFDIFELSDAALNGQAARAARILEALKGEGIHEAQILWALSRDIRTLAQLADASAKRLSSDAILKGMWQQRRQMITGALRRHQPPEWAAMLGKCAELDELVKGMRKGNAWNELLQLTLWFAGSPLWRSTASNQVR